MAGTTVKIDAETYAKLKAAVAETGEPMIEVLAKAVEAYQRQRFLEGLNADFAALRQNRAPGPRSKRNAPRGTQRWPTTSRGSEYGHALRGEIWMIDFDPTRGHEQAGRRPALVVSDDVFNAGPAGLVMVLPVTTKPKACDLTWPCNRRRAAFASRVSSNARTSVP